MWHQKSFVEVLTHCTFILLFKKRQLYLSATMFLHSFLGQGPRKMLNCLPFNPLRVTGVQFLYTFTTESNTEVMRVLDITTH